MNVAISNIAWDPSEETEVATLLQELNIKGVEIAPSKIWSNPTEVSESKLKEYRNWWADRGISIVGMQALLYNKPELTIFESDERRQNTFQYISELIRVASTLGVKAMVFGSPKNRKIGTLSKEQVDHISVDFFQKLGQVAVEHDTKFCIEANPKDYDCDFVTTLHEAIALVRKVNSPGFRLHLDTGGVILNKEDLRTCNGISKSELAHFHVSEPFLKVPNHYPDAHKHFGSILKELNYEEWVSIEMLPPVEQRLQQIESVLKNVKRWYT